MGLAETAARTFEQQPSIWWQALYSRDQRFDGRFFIGAATTKIYCRPICPVPFARPNNLVWFASAAAAEAAGYLSADDAARKLLLDPRRG